MHAFSVVYPISIYSTNDLNCKICCYSGKQNIKGLDVKQQFTCDVSYIHKKVQMTMFSKKLIAIIIHKLQININK